MSLVSEMLLWEECGLFRTRLRTNTNAARLLRRLGPELSEQIKSLDTIRSDPAHGGNGFYICWQKTVTREEILSAFDRL